MIKKYGGLKFYDINTKKMFYMDAKKLNWTRLYRDQSGGYSIVCYYQDYNEDEPNYDNMEPSALCKGCSLHELICKYYKKTKSSRIKVVTQTDDDDNDNSSTTSSDYTSK